MALAPLAQATDVAGCFVEKEYGQTFEFSVLKDVSPFGEKYTHKIWLHGGQFRYALVKKTVAFVVTDEDQYGDPIVDKWDIKKFREYQK